MRTNDLELQRRIREYMDEYCDSNGYGPTVREIAAEMGCGVATAQRYLTILEEEGQLTRRRHGYQSNALARASESTRSVPLLGAVPCGPLTEIEEYIEGYVRLPESFTGKGKFYFLTASGNSMIGAGIEDGDLVLIRQQQEAQPGDIVVALVDNEVTLKRLAHDPERDCMYLHPENRRMKDIYVDRIEIQGVAVKVVKDLGAHYGD